MLTHNLVILKGNDTITKEMEKCRENENVKNQENNYIDRPNH